MDILIIDPSSSYREIVKQILLAEDVGAVECGKGAEALEYLQNHKPAAISVAHELGDMDSFAFLREIRQMPSLANTPCFLLTSNTTQDFKRQAYDAGFTEIFIKTDFPTLKRALRSLVLYATTNIEAKVLYIEDAQSTADYTSHIMRNAGWDVMHVKSGEDAVKLLDDKANQFDLVVTDLVLEGRISGIGLINLIRQGDEDIRLTPILAVSGWNDLLRQYYVLKHGAGDFIAKPFHETDFLARAINLILGKKKLDEIREKKKALYEKVNIDALTGLNNRHFIEEFGSAVVQEAIEGNEDISLALLDIDYFKTINDEGGHAFGDQVLRLVGALVKGQRKPEEVVARYGGDELIFLMPGCQHQEAQDRMEYLREAIEKLMPQGISITASIGVACHNKKVVSKLVALLDSVEQTGVDQEKVNFDILFQTADKALYQSKEAGRNRVTYACLLEHAEQDMQGG